MSQLAVIIPYFQRERGSLRTAVQSVFDQRGVSIPITIFVVDDESPITPQDELSGLSKTQSSQIQILRQPNAGPGKARNKALNALDHTFHYVAFLDSDDRWADFHLANAIKALRRGYDFYFSDFFQLSQSVSAFKRAGRINPAEHPRLDPDTGIHLFSGDMTAQILTGNIIGTSTVCYQYRNLAAVRFSEHFRHAGEDYIFWLRIARLTDKFVFSSDTECFYGKGVNIYSGALWGSIHSMYVLHDDIRWRRDTLKEFSLTPNVRAQVRARIVEKRKEFFCVMLHRLIRLSPIPLSLLLRQLLHDPACILQLPAAFLSCAAAAVSRRA